MSNFGSYHERELRFYESKPVCYARKRNRAQQNTMSALKKARFEERLEVKFDVDYDMRARVPNMVLEPIIENAVNHGVLPKEEGGRVNVSIKREGKNAFVPGQGQRSRHEA